MEKEDTIREKQNKGNIKNINKILILVTLPLKGVGGCPNPRYLKKP